jgi:hypothetical protein
MVAILHAVRGVSNTVVDLVRNVSLVTLRVPFKLSFIHARANV